MPRADDAGDQKHIGSDEHMVAAAGNWPRSNDDGLNCAVRGPMRHSGLFFFVCTMRLPERLLAATLQEFAISAPNYCRSEFA